MLCCIVVSLSELNLFLSAIERIRIVKINKATVVCKHGHPSHQRGRWGQRGNCAWILHICVVPAIPWIWFCVKNSGDYSGAVQNTAALSEIAEVLFFILFLHCGAFSKDSQDEQPKSVILYKKGWRVKVGYSVQIKKGTVKLFWYETQSTLFRGLSSIILSSAGTIHVNINLQGT